jgi:hypothetical protein
MRTHSLVGLCLVFCLASRSFAEEKEPFEQLLIRGQIAGANLSHVDGGVLMRGNQPACAFGVVQLPEQKPQYSYFVMFKELPASKEQFSVTGPLRSKNNKLDYKVVIRVGKKQFEIAHKMAYDSAAKKVSTDELRIGDQEIKPEDGRFYLVDLATEPPTVKAVDLPLPEPVIDPQADGRDTLGAIKDIVKTLRASPDLGKLLR